MHFLNQFENAPLIWETKMDHDFIIRLCQKLRLNFFFHAQCKIQKVHATFVENKCWRGQKSEIAF